MQIKNILPDWTKFILAQFLLLTLFLLKLFGVNPLLFFVNMFYVRIYLISVFLIFTSYQLLHIWLYSIVAHNNKIHIPAFLPEGLILWCKSFEILSKEHSLYHF